VIYGHLVPADDRTRTVFEVYTSEDPNVIRRIHNAVTADTSAPPLDVHSACAMSDAIWFLPAKGTPGDALYLVYGSRSVRRGADEVEYGQWCLLRSVAGEIACQGLTPTKDGSDERRLRDRISAGFAALREKRRALRESWKQKRRMPGL